MTTLPFDAFWAWLQQHPSCILRVSTPEAVLYDDDSFHWFIGPDQSELVIQLIRGKRLVGEILLDPDRIAYVQDIGEERQGEHGFEAISESPTDRVACYSFVLAHGLDLETEGAHGPAVH